MASSSIPDCLDLVQAAKAGDEVRKLVRDLARYFRIEDIEVATGYSKVPCVEDESQVLAEIREEFKKELGRSKKLVDILQTIIPSEEKKYAFTFAVRLLALQNLSDLKRLVSKDDCIILIPVAIIGLATAILEEQGTARRTTFEFEVGSEFILSGQCSIYMQPKSKVVCVVLSMGRNKK